MPEFFPSLAVLRIPVKLRGVGNSLYLRMPAAIRVGIRLEEEDIVDLCLLTDGRLLIERTNTPVDRNTAKGLI